MKQYCTELWEHYGEVRYYCDIYPSIGQVKMCVQQSDPIYEVDVVAVSEATDTPYWGWIDNDGNISMIHHRFLLFEMCFPYGVESEELKGNGRATRVSITEICEIKKR